MTETAQVDGITLGRFHEVNEAAFSGIKQARKAVVAATKELFKEEKVGKEASAILLHKLSNAMFGNFQDFLFTPGFRTLVSFEQRSRFFADVFHCRATKEVTEMVGKFKDDMVESKRRKCEAAIIAWSKQRYQQFDEKLKIADYSDITTMVDAAIEAVWQLHLAFHGLIQLPTIINLGCKTMDDLKAMRLPRSVPAAGPSHNPPRNPPEPSWEQYEDVLELRGERCDDPGKVPSRLVQTHPGFFIGLVTDSTTVRCQAYYVTTAQWDTFALGSSSQRAEEPNASSS
eukprot:m.153442 g.153442  ORF g.153442 m.153442 type:complete len:286 (-) comp16370_c0_seq5:85-942(-)